MRPRQSGRRFVHSERFLHAVTDNVPVRLGYFDLQGRLQFVNRALCERFGMTREQVVGKTLNELFQAAPESAMAERLKQALTGVAQRFEYADVFNENVRHILTQLIPDADEGGRVLGVFGVGVDISAEVAARHELDRQTAILNAIVDSIPALVTLGS